MNQPDDRQQSSQDLALEAAINADELFKLETFLPYRLSVLTNRISRELSKLYQERFGLSIPEWRVMANLGRFAPMSAQDVAERSSMDKAKVSRAIASLQKAKLITRDQDPKDNRAVLLNLSSEGRRIYDEITPLATEWERSLLQGLGADEAKSLHQIIDRLHRRMDDSMA